MLNSLLFFCCNNRPKASDILTKKGRRRSFCTPLAPFKGTWSDNCKEITFEEGKYLFAYALIGDQYAEFFRVTNIKLTRAK